MVSVYLSIILCNSFVAGGLGMRHFVTFMLFLGMANAYVMRTNMSVAIVAMVNHTALPVISEHMDTECGEDSSNITVSIIHIPKYYSE